MDFSKQTSQSDTNVSLQDEEVGFRRNNQLAFDIQNQKSMMSFDNHQKNKFQQPRSNYSNYKVTFQFPEQTLGLTNSRVDFQKYHLQPLYIKVHKDDYMYEIIQQFIAQINQQLKEDSQLFELIDDVDLYEVGFSKKSGMLKTDYPTLEHNAKNISKSSWEVRLTIIPKDNTDFIQTQVAHNYYTNNLRTQTKSQQLKTDQLQMKSQQKGFRLFKFCHCPN